ncbi:hypothetical protein GCM10027093_45720 [Paraburkholderia jirisanensis]
MTDQYRDDLPLHDVKDLLDSLTPFEMVSTILAGRGGLRVLQELATRGITAENLAQLQSEVQHGLTLIETTARLQGVHMSELDGSTTRAGKTGMH